MNPGPALPHPQTQGTHVPQRGRLLGRARRVLNRAGRRRVTVALGVLLRPLASVESVATNERLASLTFDDGPDPVATPAILDVLAAAGATATFFVLADRAERYPEIVRRIVEDGHEIGVHGVDHSHLADLTGEALRAQVAGARDRIAAVAGVAPTLFRPPFGEQTVAVLREVRRAGLKTVLWSHEAADWEDRDASLVTAALLEGAVPGGILLFHDVLVAAPGEKADVTTFDRALVVRSFLQEIALRGMRAVSTVELLGRGDARHRLVLY